MFTVLDAHSIGQLIRPTGDDFTTYDRTAKDTDYIRPVSSFEARRVALSNLIGDLVYAVQEAGIAIAVLYAASRFF